VTPAALPLPILILTGFLSGAGIRLADPLLALIASGFDATVAAAAPVVAAFTLAYGLAQPVLGPLGDRFGKLRLIAVCMACYGAATVAAALAPTLGTLTAARAVAGAFAGGLIPVAIALIGDATTYANRQATLGRFMTGMVLSNLITAPLAGIAGDAVGWRPVFALLGAAALAAAAPLWREAARRPPLLHVPGASALARYATLLRRPSARRLLVLVGLEGAFAFGAPPFIGAFLVEDYGLSFTWAGLILGAAGLGALLYTRIAGLLVRRFGERGLLIGGGAGLVVWLGGVALAPPLAAVAAANFVGGLALASFHGVLQARGSEMLPESRSTGMAAFAFCLFVGLAAGAGAVGALLPLVGYRALFGAAATGTALVAAAAAAAPRGARA
jgi:predicted MFS family arabinose efflux permease